MIQKTEKSIHIFKQFIRLASNWYIVISNGNLCYKTISTADYVMWVLKLRTKLSTFVSFAMTPKFFFGGGGGDKFYFG